MGIFREIEVEGLKIKDGFMLRQVAGEWVVVPLGERVVEFNGIMTLSESGALLWQELEKDVSHEELVKAILREYEINEEIARFDIREFIAKLEETKLIV